MVAPSESVLVHTACAMIAVAGVTHKDLLLERAVAAFGSVAHREIMEFRGGWR